MTIATNFWYMEHFELNLEVNIPSCGRYSLPQATLTSVERIWKYMRRMIRRYRIENHHLISEPRLRSLDVVAGAYRPLSHPEVEDRWGLHSQQRFTIDLAEHDDEARQDVAKVRCAELEALKNKFGRGEPILRNEWQKELYDGVLERANNGNGVPKPRDSRELYDRELTRPMSFWELHDPLRFFYR